MSHTLDELMRDSLDHCVKCTICETYCPVAAATPLFPGPKYVGPAGRALPRARRPVAGRVARLLLELRHLHPGVPAGREDRRDQQPGPGRAEGGPRRAAARPAHRAPDPGRAPGVPGRADRQLEHAHRGRCGRSLEKTLGIHRDAPLPEWAGRAFQPLGAPRGHAPAARPARATGRSSTSTAAASNYYEPDAAQRAVDGARAQRARGDRAPAGLLRPAAPEQRPVRRRARLRAAPGRAARALRARRPRHRGDLHELRADAEARGARDPGRRGRRPAGGRRAPLRHLRVPADAPRPRRAATPTSRRWTWRCPTTPPASSAATASARRRWS